MQQEAQSVNTDAAEEAAFLAENAKIYHVDDSPAQEIETQQETVTQEAEGQEEPAQPVEAWKKEIDEARAEIAKLRKSLDSTNGTYGSRLAEQQKIIDELKQQKAQSVEQTQQQVGNLSPEKLKRLKQEFPELAEVLAEDLSELIGQPQTDLSNVEGMLQKKLDDERKAIRQELEQELKQKEIRLLKQQHPDFIEVAGYGKDENGFLKWNNPAFGNWLVSQPENIQQLAIQGSDAFELSSLITDYKNSLKQTQQSNRLNQAIQPKGSPPIRESTGGMDEEDRAFHKEWKKQAQRF